MSGPWCPSAVNDFMACPRKFVLRRQGTPERTQSAWSPGLIAGTVYHAGMKHDIDGTEWDVLDLVNADWPTGSPDIHPERVASAIVRGILDTREVLTFHSGIVSLEDILGGPEEEAKIHGRYAGTADLITEDEQGLIVTDYKTHWKREARYADAELRETQRSWQLKQYAWFAHEKYARPVTRVRKILVYFTPVLKVWSVEYPVTPEALSAWYSQALNVWEEMDRYEGYPVGSPQNDDSCERYGWDYRCSYYNHCWEGA